MKFRFITPVLLILFPYLLIVPFITGISLEFGVRYFSVILVGLLASLFLNVLNVFTCQMGAAELARWNLVIKLALIPFHCIIALLGFGFMPAIPILFVLTYSLLLASSCYGIRGLMLAREEPLWNPKLFWRLMIPHFFLIADVIAAIIFHNECKAL